MIKALKEYYNEVMLPAWGWLKRHYIGYVIFTIIAVLGTALFLYLEMSNTFTSKDDAKEETEE